MNKPYTDLSSIITIKDTSLFENINIFKDQLDIITMGLNKS